MHLNRNLKLQCNFVSPPTFSWGKLPSEPHSHKLTEQVLFSEYRTAHEQLKPSTRINITSSTEKCRLLCLVAVTQHNLVSLNGSDLSIPPDSDSNDRQDSKEGRTKQQENEGCHHLSSSPDFARGLAIPHQADL